MKVIAINANPFNSDLLTFDLLIPFSDVKKGDVLRTDREDEGTVQAQENYGECKFDQRPESLFVKIISHEDRMMIGNQFFICIYRDQMVEVSRTLTKKEAGALIGA